MPTIIAVATHKGGTGKTVTAMALSAALARAGHRTLLVDLDPQGHATLGLGIEIQNGSATLRDALSETATPCLPFGKRPISPISTSFLRTSAWSASRITCTRAQSARSF